MFFAQFRLVISDFKLYWWRCLGVMNDYNLKNIELETLWEISKLVGSALDLDITLEKVLKILNEKLHMERATLLLLDESGQILRIKASVGLSPEQEHRGIYRISEGVCGKVASTATPFVVKDVESEPLFLNKTGARTNIKKGRISFIGVPIVVNNHVVGVLTVDRLFGANISFEEDVNFLTVVATLIGQFLMLHNAINLRHAHLIEENRSLKAELNSRYSFSNIVGNSKALTDLFRLIKKVAPSDVTILIMGESGTGKELVARAIHKNSPRASGPFIKVNCAALPETLLESELFGHVKGAFTGAVTRRIGRFEAAHGGTLFLDEIGEMPASLQSKLLRAIQEREFERVGSTRTISVDVRIIAATNRNLEEAVRKGEFRQDLYYRLNIVPIVIPPLRERKADILPLVDHFLRKSNRRHRRRTSLSKEVMDVFTSYDWPGNVRELENLIERLVIISEKGHITPKDLPLYMLPELMYVKHNGNRGGSDKSVSRGESDPVHVKLRTLQEIEREEIISALSRNGWIQTKAAKELGLTQRQIGYRIKKYNIRPPWE